MKKKATTNAMGLQLESRASYIKRSLLRDWQLYTLLIPALVAVILFHYVPMYGVQIAFKNFKISKGIWGSAWVGLKYFDKFVRTAPEAGRERSSVIQQLQKLAERYTEE